MKLRTPWLERRPGIYRPSIAYAPREYQVECVAHFKPWYREPPQQGLIALACGLGKTRTGAYCIENLMQQNPGAQTLWIIDRQEPGRPKDAHAAASKEHGQALAGTLYRMGIRVPQLYYDTPRLKRPAWWEHSRSGRSGAFPSTACRTETGFCRFCSSRPLRIRF